MTTPNTVRLVVAITALGLASVGGAQAPAAAQALEGPDVSVDPEIRCWSHGEHPLVYASVEPDAPITRLYFRCSLYPDYYFVDLEREGDRYTAVLPQATDECPAVHYYLEAVSVDFASSRTRERVADVSEASECRRRDPLVALFSGSPRIIVGATSALAPEMAPGFSLAGVVGYISAGGAASAGGIGAATIAGVGGPAAATGVVVANVGDDGGGEPAVDEIDSPATGDPGGGGGAPAADPPSSPPAPSGDTSPVACVSTDPSPAVIGAGDAIRLDASCSRADREGDTGDRITDYIWDFSDGRQKTGRVVNALFREPGVYEITLTVIDGESSLLLQQDTTTFEVTVEDRVTACFTASDFDPGTGCKVRVDASCSTGNIELYSWTFSDGFGSYNFTGRTVVKDWVSCPLSTTVTLTVTSETGNKDTVSMPVFVTYQKSPARPGRAELVATMQGVEAGAGGRLTANERESFHLGAAGPRRILLSARAGVNRLSVHLVGPSTGTGIVTLDFRSDDDFVSGSLQVREGEVVALGARRVRLRLTSPARVEYRRR